MAQTYQSGDKVVVVSGPDAGRNAIVVDNFEGVYGDDLTDGALIDFDDQKPSKDPVAGQVGQGREFKAEFLRKA
jgi:ribosomal protein L24